MSTYSCLWKVFMKNIKFNSIHFNIYEKNHSHRILLLWFIALVNYINIFQNTVKPIFKLLGYTLHVNLLIFHLDVFMNIHKWNWSVVFIDQFQFQGYVDFIKIFWIKSKDFISIIHSMFHNNLNYIRVFYLVMIW